MTALLLVVAALAQDPAQEPALDERPDDIGLAEEEGTAPDQQAAEMPVEEAPELHEPPGPPVQAQVIPEEPTHAAPPEPVDEPADILPTLLQRPPPWTIPTEPEPDQPEPPRVIVTTEALPPALDAIPDAPEGGLGSAVVLGLVALIAWLASRTAERLGRNLRHEGLIPRLLGTIVALGRGLAVPLVVLALFALTPPSWHWAGPIALVAVALALGWTTRDLLGDLFAGAVLAVERNVRAGDRVELGGVQGVVAQLGMRSTTLSLDNGRSLLVPNQDIIRSRLQVDPEGWAPVDVPVHVGRLAAYRGDDHLHTAWVRQTLEELALLSPYLAPDGAPTVFRDPDTVDVWVVHARVVHPRYADAFKGALVELADEVFLEFDPPDELRRPKVPEG